MKEILDVIHKTIYQYLDICGDDEEVPVSDKDKLLLEVNKAICNNLKALKHELCEDAISREDALMALTGEWTESTDELIHRFIRRIKNLPSVNTQSEWIPVSEAKEGYSVLVTRITDDNCKYMRIASYQGDCWMDDTDEFDKPNPHKVIAWQPLPKPYEQQESDGGKNERN